MRFWKKDLVSSRLNEEIRQLQLRCETTGLNDDDLASAQVLVQLRQLEKERSRYRASVAAGVFLLVVTSVVALLASLPASQARIELVAETTTVQFALPEHTGFSLNLIVDSVGLAGFVAASASPGNPEPTNAVPLMLRERVRVQHLSVGAGGELALDATNTSLTFSIRCSPLCDRTRLGLAGAAAARGRSGASIYYSEYAASTDGVIVHLPLHLRGSRIVLNGFRIDSLIFSRPEGYVDGIVDRPSWTSGLLGGEIRIGPAGGTVRKLLPGQSLAIDGESLQMSRIEVDSGKIRLAVDGHAQTVKIRGEDARPSMFDVLQQDPRVKAAAVAFAAIGAILAAWAGIRGRS